MKTRTSMNITKKFDKVWYCGYGDLQFILQSSDFQFFNAGVCGWNCDIYVDYPRKQVVTTGYRNTRGERIPSELIEKYNNLSQRNNDDYVKTGNYKAYIENIEYIKEEFLKELSNI